MLYLQKGYSIEQLSLRIRLMNLTARIKGTKHKPNYVLNVNINIPIRPSHLQSDRPVSGQFTFSPNQLKKKLKLEIPSARTTYQCQSRKLSYLGETQNTISHRNNRKRTVKSAFPVEQPSSLIHNSTKSKSQVRSETVSPNKKKIGSKSSKIVGSQKNIKNGQILDKLIDQSEDNIIGYTSQSSQLTKLCDKDLKTNQPSFEDINKKDIIHKLNIKPDSPLLQQRNLISQMRQFEKTAQFKKQHLNYMYLKEKVLVLASIKKIQRAWRNYKTKKLIKSYSNNISLKFTGKLKNQLSSRQEADEVKILTVRSCGYNQKTNQFKKQGKKNLSQLLQFNEKKYVQNYMKQLQDQSQKQIQQIQIQNVIHKKSTNDKSSKNAVVKFQMEEIERWDELIKHIRDGKKIDEVLQKSFRRKKQLQKELSDNLKQLGYEKNMLLESSSSNQFHNVQVDTNKYVQITNQIVLKNQSYVQQISISSQNTYYEKLSAEYSPRVLKRQKKLPLSKDISMNDDEEEEGATTQRRRKKLQYFQNQLRKIDNQYSQSNLSQSYHSELQMEHSSPQQIVVPFNKFSRQAEIEENIKLKKKLEAINKIQLFSQLDNAQIKQNVNKSSDKNQKQQKALIKKEQHRQSSNLNKELRPQKELQTYEDLETKPFFPISINKKQIQSSHNAELSEIINDGRLDTFRNRNQQQNNLTFEYEDVGALRLIQIKKKKYTPKQKQILLQKIQQQLLYDVLLQFSQIDKLAAKIETLHLSNVIKQKQVEDNKPQGICTNLQSIKDYLQNFVAFAFEQQTLKLIQGFNNPKGPSAITLLKHLSKNQETEQANFVVPVLSIDLFNLHWAYASEQIYFDVKFQNDPIKQNQRVKSLKLITKTYFRAIFDSFNQCLNPFRVYGQIGKPFPWSPNIKKRSGLLTLHQIKPLIRLAYRKLSQMAIIYCGLLFQDKKHNMGPKVIQQIQKERLDTLVELELQDEQHIWESCEIEQAEVRWKLSQLIWEQLILEVCWEIGLSIIIR